MTEELQPAAVDTATRILERTIELILAPLNNQEMIWIAVPLLMATIFMTLYFARYKREELGWNTAFGNTMVFIFVALNIMKQMYYENGIGSFDNVLSNSLYLSIAFGLVGAGILMMVFTYFHLLPKRLAFFLFAAAPINVSVYVIMAIVYAGLPADYLTVLAGLVFLFLILILTKLIQIYLRTIGLEYRTKLVSTEIPEDMARSYGRARTDEERKILARKVAETEMALERKRKKKR